MAITRRHFCAATAARAAVAPRPNILWITSEDNGPFLGCYGDKYASTPHLDGLASQGMLYQNAFSAFPVCAPTRSTIITGVCANSAGTGHMRSQVRLAPEIRMFPALLREAGYHCTNNSKEDYNTTTPGDVWDQSNAKATYRNRRAGQPFFHVVNLNATHESSMFKPRDLVHDPKQAVLFPYHPDNEVFRRDRALYYDNVSRMDSQAGQILDQLAADGLAEDTIVFYFSDHGGVFPRAKRFVYDSGTRVPMIVRFPERFQQWRPASPGGQTDRLVGFVDLAPTVLSLAGVPIPKYMQGTAFLGDAAGKPREYAFSARDRMGPCPDLIRSARDKRYRYIRNYLPHLPAFQYDSYAMGIPCWANLWQLQKDGKLGEVQRRIFEPKPKEELYDITRDPHELENLAGRPEHRATLERMRGAVRAWVREIRDVDFIPELDMHRLSAGSSPYELARDGSRYNLERVLSAAEMAGEADVKNLPLLVNLLGDEDTVLQYWAAAGCRELGARAKPAEAALTAAMKGSASGDVRIAAAEVVCRLGKEAGLAVLQEELKSKEPWTRFFAAVALGRLGDRARPAVEALKQAAQDKENYPKLAAENALRAIG